MSTSTRDRILAASAEARGQGVSQRSHRPSHRRGAEEPGVASGYAVVRAQRMIVRAAGDGTADRLHFEGFASVYDRSYEMWDWYGPYDEQVSSGAGATSLARADLDVPLVLQHDPLRRIARTTNGTLTLAERSEEFNGETVAGLWVDAPALNRADPDVAYIAAKLLADGDTAPLIDEMSFKFRILRGEWSPDWDEYHIKEYDLHRGDVAIVAYGANPHTQGSGLRAGGMPSLDDLTDSQLRQLERSLHARLQTTPPPASAARGVSLSQIDLALD